VPMAAGSGVASARASRDPYWIAVAGIGLVLLGVVVLAYFAVRDHEFVPWEGERPSYDPEGVLVERVEVFGFELNVATEAERPRGDVVTSYLLFATASATFLASLLAVVTPGTSRARWLFLLASLGTGYLAVDEALEVHETIGANLLFLDEVPGIRRPDDLLFALYAVPVGAFVVTFRRELVASLPALALLAGALVGFVLAAIADLRDLGLENEVEAAGALLLLAGFITLAVDLVGLGRARPPART
jgi:hypothetical protein